MAELSRRPRLAQEAVDFFLRRQVACPRNLDRYDPLQLGVAGLIDGSVSPFPQLLEELKLGQPARGVLGRNVVVRPGSS